MAKVSHMKRKDFREALEGLGLFDAAGDKAGQFLDVHPRSVTRMLTGKIPIDARTAMLLRLMDTHQFKPEFVRSLLAK